MARVLVSDPIDEAGVQRLSAAGHQVDVRTGLKPDELEEAIGAYDALIVRSETKVTAAVIGKSKRLQVVGRAGVGVDNIDIDAATQNGVAVVNAPTGNTIAAAEHAFALMMSLARHIPEADASIRRSEWTRSRFMGVELRNKTLGIIGLGKVGSEVAKRARAFEMKILAMDPFVPEERAKSMGVEMVDLDRLLTDCDFITIHTPLTSLTKSLIGAEELARAKPGVRFINAARGGLIDEQALHDALGSGHVGGAALDVFPKEPPQELPVRGDANTVLTPHLGASTEEAQVEVAVEVVDQVIAVLAGESAPYTINVPFLPSDVRAVLGPYIPVATALGRIAIQLADGQLDSVALRVSGDIAEHNTGILASAALMGVLGASTDMRINLVNAPSLAKERGVTVAEEKDPEGDGQYTNLVGVEVKTSAGTIALAGTQVSGKVHLLRINDLRLDMEPSAPYMLFTSHSDQPGMIGKIGTIAGERDINISFMEVGRDAPRGRATMIVGFDDPPDAILDAIRTMPGMASIKLVTQETGTPVQPRLRTE